LWETYGKLAKPKYRTWDKFENIPAFQITEEDKKSGKAFNFGEWMDKTFGGDNPDRSEADKAVGKAALYPVKEGYKNIKGYTNKFSKLQKRNPAISALSLGTIPALAAISLQGQEGVTDYFENLKKFKNANIFKKGE
jgi:hypothetical protein